MKKILARAFIALAMCGFALTALGQTTSHSNDDDQTTDNQIQTDNQMQPPTGLKGFSAYENFRGMANSFGALLKLDSTVGYDFNNYFGVFTGVPLYFADDTSNTPGQTQFRSTGAGDVY